MYAHPRESLRQGESGDEQAGIEGGIALLANVELKDELPGIWEDGSERDGLCYPYESWSSNQYCNFDF